MQSIRNTQRIDGNSGLITENVLLSLSRIAKSAIKVTSKSNESIFHTGMPGLLQKSITEMHDIIRAKVE